MLLGEAWLRYRRSWKSLVAANLFTNLLTSGLFLWVAGGALAQLTANPGILPTVRQLQTSPSTILAWSIGLVLVSMFVQGGVYGTVASVWRDPDTPWTTFWIQGWRNWWRMIKVCLCVGFGLVLPVVILTTLAFLLLAAIGNMLSLPAVISIPLVGLLVLFGILPAVIAATYYGAYAAVADGAGGRHALGEGWRCLTAGYADCLTAALMVIVVSAILGLVALPIGLLLLAAQMPPVVSHLLTVILQSIIAPTFLLVYIAVRYETNQRR